MKEVMRERVITISDDDYERFDKKYNQICDNLAKYEHTVKDLDPHTVRFYYKVPKQIPESLEDDFNQHHESPKCADCPFLEISDDRRRKWFPCPYANYGQACIDSPACEVFYKEAVRRMREDCEL